MGAARKLKKEMCMQCGSPDDKLNRIIDKYSIRGIGGPERSISPVLATSSMKSTVSSYARIRCFRNYLFTMTTRPDGIHRCPESNGLIEVWKEDIVGVEPEKKPSPPPFEKIIKKLVDRYEKERKKVA